MSVSIIIITHGTVGKALLKAATNTFGELPLTTKVIPIKQQDDPHYWITRLQKVVKKLEHGHGILLLTDIFGSTPSNIAQAIGKLKNTRLVAGLNLPMLIRIMNYPQLTLDELTQKAITGGRDGIIEYQYAE